MMLRDRAKNELPIQIELGSNGVSVGVMGVEALKVQPVLDNGHIRWIEAIDTYKDVTHLTRRGDGDIG
jgi:hypothetical protein